MITCSICKSENDQYSTICKTCGSFLQNRIPNLDLFSTLWKIIERPRNAFQIITLAEHKNYALFLNILFGISLSFIGFWLWRIGDKYENFLPLIFSALLFGILYGCIICVLLTCWHWTLTKVFNGKTNYKISLGITSYAFLPAILSFVFILPVKLLTFGMFLFSFNPHPYTIKPIIYIILIGCDGILFLWSLLLIIYGTYIGTQLSIWKSIIIGITTYSIPILGLIYGGEYVSRFV